jgi:putative PIN family toxin of toxin-antitoxin system
MKVSIDTNIIYQALKSRKGASFAILQMVRSGELQMAISVPVFEEYRDVLNRRETISDTGRSREDMHKVLDFIALVGNPTPIDYFWRPNLRDENDNMFVELAVASGSEYLITRNVRDYTKGNDLVFDSFIVITPSAFLEEWRNRHGK